MASTLSQTEETPLTANETLGIRWLINRHSGRSFDCRVWAILTRAITREEISKFVSTFYWWPSVRADAAKALARGDLLEARVLAAPYVDPQDRETIARLLNLDTSDHEKRYLRAHFKMQMGWIQILTLEIGLLLILFAGTILTKDYERWTRAPESDTTKETWTVSSAASFVTYYAFAVATLVAGAFLTLFASTQFPGAVRNIVYFFKMRRRMRNMYSYDP